MNDYMIALLDRFGIVSPREAELTGRVKTAEENLRGELTKEQRKLLLCLTDSQNALCGEEVLYGFISGYRLAEGIRGELDAHPPFSIVAEDEQRARLKHYNRSAIPKRAQRSRPPGGGRKAALP